MKDIKKQLEEMCADIYAHAELDFEVTLEGSGVNCSEAAAVANAVLKIIGTKKSSLKKAIDAKVEELKKEFGL